MRRPLVVLVPSVVLALAACTAAPSPDGAAPASSSTATASAAPSASTDPAEVLAGTIGQAYRAASEPALGAALIAAAPSWTVQTAQDVVSLQDGSEVHAWRLQADEPFAALGGAQVQEMVVWLAPGHVVVGNQATVDVGGVQTTTLQQYSRWGYPVTIAPPLG